MSTSLGVIAQSNTSTYIVGGIDTYITDEGSSQKVECFLYFKRTNTFSGSTWSSSVSGTVTIDGESTSVNFSPTIPGNNNNWIGPYIHATKVFTGGERNITVGWSTTDNAGSYFGGSGSTTITVPASYTAPTGLSYSNIEIGPDWVSCDVSITGWGTGGTSAQRYLEASLCQNENVSVRNWTAVYGEALSANIRVDNTNATTVRQLTIAPNSRYYLTAYAANGAAGTGNTFYTPIYTRPYPPALSLLSVGQTDANIQYSFNPNDGHFLSEVIRYRINGGEWQQGSIEISPGVIELTGLTSDTEYLLEVMVCGLATGSTTTIWSESAIASMTIKTKKSHKLYGSVNGETKEIVKLYGSVNGLTKGITALYGSVNGETRRIY